MGKTIVITGASSGLGKVLATNLCPGGIATPLWGAQNPYPGEQNDLISLNFPAVNLRWVWQNPA